MLSRTVLQRKLEAVPGIKKVYFQPPSGVKLEYPCIVYTLNNTYRNNANNQLYNGKRSYGVTLITQNPSLEMVEYLETLPYSSFNRWGSINNLNHYYFTIYN